MEGPFCDGEKGDCQKLIFKNGQMIISGSTKERYRHSPAIALSFVSLLCIPAFLDLSRGQAAWCLVLFVLALAIYNGAGQRKALFDDPLVLIGLIYILSASLPVIVPSLYFDDIWSVLVGRHLNTAMVWTYRGFIALAVGYLFTCVRMSVAPQRHYNKAMPQAALRFAKIVGWIGMIGAITKLSMTGGNIYVFEELSDTGSYSSVSQVIHYFNLLGFVYVYLYRILAARHATTSRHFQLLIAILCLQGVFVIGAGAKAVVFTLLLMFLLPTGAARTGGTPLRQAIILIGMAVIIYFTFQVITVYREIVRLTTIPENSGLWSNFRFQLEAFLNAFQVLIGTFNSGGEFVKLGSILDRFGYLSSFARVLATTGGAPPYEHSLESFLLPIYAFVPREIVEKPFFFDSGSLARLEGWTFGGISVSLPGSLYWAWGYWGILWGMGILGIVLAWVTLKAQSETGGHVHYHALKAIMILGLANVGGTFHSILIDMLRYAFFLWVIGWINGVLIRPVRRRCI